LKLLVTGLLSITLAAVLISCLHPRRNRPGGDTDRRTTLKGHSFPVQVLAFGPDGASLTSVACYPGVPKRKVATWDVETGNLTAKRIDEYSGALRYLALANGGQRLAAAVQERTLLPWDVAPWHERSRPEAAHPFINAIALSDDGTQLATIANANEVTLWDVNNSKPKVCREACAGVACVAFAPGRAIMALGLEDRTIRLWSPVTGEERGALQGSNRSATVLVFSPDAGLLASGDHEGKVTLWDVATGTKRAVLETTADRVFSTEVPALAFAPDGRMLAVAVDRAVQLWDVATGKLATRLEGHEGKVRCLAFSPDGTHLASGSYDQTVRLWNMTQSRSIRP
jgi:WD40 repeat protein